MEVTSEEINENDGISLRMYSTIARMKENKQKRDKCNKSYGL
jgi:hypothetical protein